MPGGGGGGTGADDVGCTGPVTRADATAGTDGSGGGGGGGAGSIPGASGGAGGGQVRTPAPTGPVLPAIQVCAEHETVTYGQKVGKIDIDYCVPIGQCFPAPATTGGGTGPSGPSGTTGTSGPSGPSHPHPGIEPGDGCCPTSAPTGLSGPLTGTFDPEDCDPHAPTLGAATSASGTTGSSATSDTLAPTAALSPTASPDSPDLDFARQAQQWVGSTPTPDGPTAPDATPPVPGPKNDGLPSGYYEVEPEQIQDLYGVTPPTCTVTGYTASTPVSASPLPFTCTGGDPGSGYTFDYSLINNQGLIIQPAELTVKPDDQHLSYGNPVPTYTYKVRGFKLKETPATASGWVDPTCTSSYTTTSPAGSHYAITCSGGAADNYVFKYQPGQLQVGRRRVHLAPLNRTVTYGDPTPSYGFTLSPLDATPTALLPDSLDQPSLLSGYVAPTCGSSYAPGTAAGQVTVTCSGGGSDNYEFDTPTTGTLTVNPATLTVSPRSVSVPYGSSAPAYAFDMSGFVHGDTTPGAGYQAPTCTSAYSPKMAVGTTVVVSCSGGKSNNYNLDVSKTATLTVVPAKLTVTPDAKTVTYGSPAPTYTYKVAGFVNGDTASVLTSAPSCSLNYTPTTPVGTSVLITCSAASTGSYSVDTTTTAALTVTKAPLTVTADAKSVTYGSAAPAYTATVSGFVNGQSVSVLSSLPTCSSAYTSATGAGSVAITCSGGSASNYALSYVAGTLTVNKATLTVTPDNKYLVHGAAVPTYTFTVSGFVNGQSTSTAASYVAPKCTSSYTTSSKSGTYTITCSSGSATNYAFSYKTASLVAS